tara:strand:+ start:160 stop:477 length:318 start_codon:yes stop_codon:yes gene_type:complete
MANLYDSLTRTPQNYLNFEIGDEDWWLWGTDGRTQWLEQYINGRSTRLRLTIASFDRRTPTQITIIFPTGVGSGKINSLLSWEDESELGTTGISSLNTSPFPSGG